MKLKSLNLIRYSLAAPLLAGLLGACAPLGEEPAIEGVEEEGYVSLFDGESLKGWRKIGGGAAFIAEDGDLVGMRGPGHNTFLRTEKSYGDFILKMDMRFDIVGNSGILFRAHQRQGGRAYGYQYELDNKVRQWSGGIYDEARRGWLAPVDNNESARAAMKMDDWNQLVIEAVGGTIKTWLNDVPVSHLVDSMDLEGFIALQVHSGKQGQIRWRNIRIKELGEHQWTSDGVLSPAAWITNGAKLKAEDGNLKATWPAQQEQARVLGASLPLGDFAMRFTLKTCEQPTKIHLRNSYNQKKQFMKGLQLQVTDQLATLTNNDKNNTQTFVRELDSSNKEKTLTITAVGDQVTIAVDEQHLGRFIDYELPRLGEFRIEPGNCEGEVFELQQLSWIDLSQAQKSAGN